MDSYNLGNLDNQLSSKRFAIVVLYVILVLYALLCVYPLLWMMVNSFKSNQDIFNNPWGLPARIVFDGYINAFSRGNILLYLYNSVTVTVIAGIFCLILSSMAAYGIQRMKWKLSKLTFAIFLMGIMIPVHSIVIPLYISFTKIGLSNTRWGLIIPYIVTSMPFSILVLVGFLQTLPIEYEEAAFIEGCGLFKSFIKIVIPLLKPAIATVIILNFINMWNELFLALILISNKDLYTLPIGATRFRDLYSQNYTPMFAFLTLTVTISITVYLVFQKRIVAGIITGGLKG
jgi:raffinose/stachyose/melibiose transport system permease protein